MTELRPDDLRSDFYNRTSEQALIAFSIECSDSSFFKTQSIEVPAIEYMKHLEHMVLELKAQLTDQTVEKFQEIIRNQCDEISALKAQLTWRPVSEKPDKDGWYLCKIQYIDDFIGEETVFFNGERFVSSDVIKWLPIPPAPEVT